MKQYFESIYNDNQEEIGFQLNIESIDSPKIEIESFESGKIKLKIKGEMIFWSSFSLMKILGE